MKFKEVVTLFLICLFLFILFIPLFQMLDSCQMEQKESDDIIKEVRAIKDELIRMNNYTEEEE